MMPDEGQEAGPLDYETPALAPLPRASRITNAALANGAVGIACIILIVVVFLIERRVALGPVGLVPVVGMLFAWPASVAGIGAAGYALGRAPRGRAGVALALNVIVFISPAVLRVLM